MHRLMAISQLNVRNCDLCFTPNFLCQGCPDSVFVELLKIYDSLHKPHFTTLWSNKKVNFWEGQDICVFFISDAGCTSSPVELFDVCISMRGKLWSFFKIFVTIWSERNLLNFLWFPPTRIGGMGGNSYRVGGQNLVAGKTKMWPGCKLSALPKPLLSCSLTN